MNPVPVWSTHDELRQQMRSKMESLQIIRTIAAKYHGKVTIDLATDTLDIDVPESAMREMVEALTRVGIYSA